MRISLTSLEFRAEKSLDRDRCQAAVRGSKTRDEQLAIRRSPDAVLFDLLRRRHGPPSRLIAIRERIRERQPHSKAESLLETFFFATWFACRVGAAFWKSPPRVSCIVMNTLS
jgi:hypothetical protein